MKLVGATLGAKIALRLVTKSLPSIQLLEHMMIAACTNRVMAFSEGMVRDLLCRWGTDIDVFSQGELVDQWSTFQPGIRLA